MDLDPNNSYQHEEMAELCPTVDDGNMSGMSSSGMRSTGNQKVDMWRNRNFDSGFQTMNHSEAPSIISSIHPSSHMSGMSSVADYDQIPSLSDQQKQKFDHISYGAGDVQYGSAVRAVPELTNLMKDADHAVVYKAVYIMQNIAKMDSDPMRRHKDSVINDFRVIIALRDILREKPEHPNIIRFALGTMFNICNRQEGLELFAHAVRVQPDIVQYLVQHIGTFEFSCYKYALLTLHSILQDKHRSSQPLILARQYDALKSITPWLESEKSEKLLPVIVDLVRILCERQNEQKAIFLRQRGTHKLLQILQTARYENLLWRCTQLLKTFSNFDANNLVALGARETLSRLLNHESQRLILSALETIRNISDVPFQYKEDILLKSLIMLLGSRHPLIMLYTVQILSNLVANHKHNKELLVCNNATDLLLRALVEANGYMPCTTSKEARMMEEYIESLLCTLRQLCVGHSYCEKVQLNIFKDPTVYLEKLSMMRPILLKQTLNLLLKLASHNSLLLQFRDTRAGQTCFVEQIVHIWKVACNQSITQEQIEGVSLRGLINVCVELLRILGRNQDIIEQIVYFLRTPENTRIGEIHTLLPIFVLQKANIDESTKKSTLLLLYSLMNHEQMYTLLESNQVFLNIIQQFQVCHTTPDLAKIADGILKHIFEKKERLMYGRYNPMAELNKFASNSHNSSMNESNNDPMDVVEMRDGAGEQWSQIQAGEDPFVEMYCGATEKPTSKAYNSPSYNSPTPMFTEYATPQPLVDNYYDQSQPSTSAAFPYRPPPSNIEMNHLSQNNIQYPIHYETHPVYNPPVHNHGPPSSPTFPRQQRF